MTKKQKKTLSDLRMRKIYEDKKENKNKETINCLTIGLDPSTANVGWAILAEGNPILDQDNYASYGVILLGSTAQTFSDRTLENMEKVKYLCSDFHRWLTQLALVYKIKNIVLGVELAPVRKANVEIGRKLNFYAGLVTSLILSVISDQRLGLGWPDIKLNLVNPSTWQNYYSISKNTKEESIKIANEIGKGITDDNIADAINIANYVWRIHG